MKRILLPILMSLLLLSYLNAETMKGQDPELSELIGRFVLTLSKDHIVSVQDFAKPTLWADAKLGRVEHPNGMLASMGTHFETEMVPTESGIVLRFSGPYPIHATQKAWSTSHDTERKTFEIVVNTSNGKFIGIEGEYGANFPVKTVEDLMTISTKPTIKP